MKQPQKDSKRTKRRLRRGNGTIIPSKYLLRVEKRLAARIAAWDATGGKNRESEQRHTKPGSRKCA